MEFFKDDMKLQDLDRLMTLVWIVKLNVSTPYSTLLISTQWHLLKLTLLESFS